MLNTIQDFREHFDEERREAARERFKQFHADKRQNLTKNT